MSNPEISVIVPIYNREKYLTRCIDSILSQSFTDFELILVDDGSKDRSLEICREYEKKDSRVTVGHQENGGVSSARNHGLSLAHGKYVTFCDSDDAVEPNWLGGLYNGYHSENVKLTVCGIRKVHATGRILHCDRLEDQNIPFNEFYVLRRIGDFASTCNKLFVLDVIQKSNILFDENICHYEDELFVLDYLRTLSGNHIMVTLASSPYLYYINGGEASLSKQLVKDYPSVVDFFYHKFIAVARKLGSDSQKMRETMLPCLNEKINALLYIIIHSGNYHGLEKISELKKLTQSSAFKALVSNPELQDYVGVRYARILKTRNPYAIYFYNLLSKIIRRETET